MARSSSATMTALMLVVSWGQAEHAAAQETRQDTRQDTRPQSVQGAEEVASAADGEDEEPPAERDEAAVSSEAPPASLVEAAGSIPPAPTGGAAPPAPAPTFGIAGNDRAELHFELAEAHFAAGRYDRALIELQTVRELTGSQEVLYNMGRSYEAMGRRQTAIRYYERFIAADIGGPIRRDALGRLAALRDELEEDTGQSTGPGVGTYIGLAVGGAGLLVGGIFGALTLAEDARLMDGCGATGSCSGEDLSDIRTYRTVTDLSLMAAAIGGTAGLIALFLWMFEGEAEDDDENEADAPRAAWVTPYVLPGQGAGAAAMVRF